MARKHKPTLLSVSRSAFPKEIANDATKRGQLAAPKVLFGEFSRYAVAPLHSRFGSIVWFVWDAEKSYDETKAADIIRQGCTFEEAVSDLW